MKFYKTKWFWIVAFIVVVGLIIIVKSQGGEEEYITQKVERVDIEKTVTATGIAKPPHSFNLAFPFSGIVKEINVEVGDWVEKGTTLAKLDSNSLFYESQKTKAIFEGDLKSAQLDWEAAKEDLEKTLAVNKEKKDQTRTKVHDAEDYLEKVKEYANKVRRESGSSSSAYKQAKYIEQAAENSYKEALDNHALVKKQAEESEANARQALRDAEENLRQKSERLSASTLSYNRANYLLSLDTLSKATLKAPTSGIVTGVNNEVGEIASSTLPTISFISEGLEVEVDIPEADIAKIYVGQGAEVTFDAFGDERVFSGEVIKIDPAQTLISDVVYYKTKIILHQDTSDVKPGMTANITIKIQSKENVLAIPQIAVIEKDGKDFVRVLENGKPVEVEVETGIVGDSGLIEIVSGLREEQKVIVSESK